MLLSLCFLFGAREQLHATRGEPITDYRYEVAKRVFDDLVEAKGVRNMPVPRFIMLDVERHVAWSKKKEAEIGLEAKAYAICADLGKDSLNALAAVLSHEVIHYYEKHGWTALFADANPDLESLTADESMDAWLAQEAEADYFGGFLSYAAGYQTLDIMPVFLEKVYEEYGFDSKMPGYPSLAERQQMAQSSLERCQMLIHVFEMANYMVAIGDYRNAKTYYEYVLKEFQSRELYNNLGVVVAMEAITLFSKTELRYVYPFELDGESRLRSTKKGGLTDFANQKLQREELLLEAIQYFKTAMLLDESYSASYLNIGSAYALLNELEDAEYFARKVQRMAGKNENDKILADAQVLLGIIALSLEDPEEANQCFAKAVVLGNRTGQINQSILNATNEALPLRRIPSASAKIAPIENVSLDRLVIQLDRGELESTHMIELNAKTVFALIEKEQSTIMVHLKPYEEESFFLHITGNTFESTKATSRAIGTPLSAVLEEYQEPESRLELLEGLMLVYPDQQLLFYFDEDDRLSRWAIYK